jgi:hypothetical protein
MNPDDAIELPVSSLGQLWSEILNPSPTLRRHWAALDAEGDKRRQDGLIGLDCDQDSGSLYIIDHGRAPYWATPEQWNDYLMATHVVEACFEAITNR